MKPVMIYESTDGEVLRRYPYSRLTSFVDFVTVRQMKACFMPVIVFFDWFSKMGVLFSDFSSFFLFSLF